MKDFIGKVAVVTGAASGIGLAIARRCAKASMKVVLADVDGTHLNEVEAELSVQDSPVIAVKTDVSKRSEVEELARVAIEAYGQVHLLFNNAGVGAGGAPWEATWNDWEWVVNVNLWGVIHGVKIFTPLMLAQNTECHIINTSSGAGLVVGGFSAPYSVTKHAVVALSESLYLTLQQRNAKVKVSVLCPGLVHTNIGESERNRPAQLRNEHLPLSPEMQAGRATFQKLVETSMPPEHVAERVFEAIRERAILYSTHPEWSELIQMRMESLRKMENPQDPSATIAKLLSRRAG